MLVAIYGLHGTRNKVFEPQNEFKLDNWVHLGDLLDQQGRAVPGARRDRDVRDHDLHRAAHAAAPEQGADRRRAALPADARQHHRQRDEREDGRQVVPVHRRAVPVHHLLEPDRLHPAADEHRAQDQRRSALHIPSFSLYAATANLSIPLVLALVVFVSYTFEGVRAKGPIGYLKGLVPGGVRRRHGRLDLLPRGALEPDADPLADDSSVREHPRRAT